MMLTETTIKNAQPQAQPFIVWCERVRGFGCRVFPKGQKSFVIMYRRDGVRVLAKIGRVGDVTLSDARKRAATELLKVREGQDDLQTRRREHRNAPTVQDLWARFERDYINERCNVGRMVAKTARDYARVARLYILPALAGLRVKDVKRSDVEGMAAAIKFRTQRNRVLSVTSKLFTFAEATELRGQGSNPVKFVARSKEAPRDRVLNATELRALNQALLALEDRHLFEVRAIVTATLTGLRASEVLSLRWEDVDLEQERAVLPKTKTGRRAIALAGPVRDLLAGLPRINGSTWVFPSSRIDAAATYRNTRGIFAKAAKAAGVNDCQLHDLRRSFLTMLASAGFNAFAIRDAAGHSSLSMANRYVQETGLAATAERGATLALERLTGGPVKTG